MQLNHWVAGIDAGSTAIKAALFNGRDFSFSLAPTGWQPKKVAEQLLNDLAVRQGIHLPNVVVATGYGRKSLELATRAVTEIACHARGAAYLAPGCRFVIDIGGQDAKGIAVSPEGHVEDFVMNDKCAAGTGRFLSVTATALGMDVEELTLAAESAEPYPINSMCTVFAESEVIGLIHQGIARSSVVAGLHASVARRVASMVSRFDLQDRIVFTGGVSRNADIACRLEAELGKPVMVPPNGMWAGAIGAALYAWDDLQLERGVV